MTKKDEVVVIGITGGIGSGKSTIADWIRELGYPVISSDEIAKQEMAENTELKQRLIKEFGDEIYHDDGKLNKELLSDLIFDEKNSKIKRVNQIVHPYAIDSIVGNLESLANEGNKLIFVESALMIESGMAEGYDYIITIFTDEDKVIERVQKRSKLTESKIKLIMQSQLNPIEKKKLADFVILNNGDIKDLRHSFDSLFPIIKDLPTNQ